MHNNMSVSARPSKNRRLPVAVLYYLSIHRIAPIYPMQNEVATGFLALLLEDACTFPAVQSRIQTGG